jgi:WD40 repeat protein
MIECGEVTVLAAREFGGGSHLVCAGQIDGMVRVWLLGLEHSPPAVKCVLEKQAHEGAITAVDFVDGNRVASGGADRRVVVSRFNCDALESADGQERVLHLTLRCKGLRIEGIQGPVERRRLEELIRKAEQQIQSRPSLHVG